jgi:hypothetical protein
MKWIGAPPLTGEESVVGAGIGGESAGDKELEQEGRHWWLRWPR